MITSEEITAKVSKNGKVDLDRLDKEWSKVRYCIAIKRADKHYRETNSRYYKGYAVMPGPRANIEVCGRLQNTDLTILQQQHGIRFVDYQSTDDADDKTRLSEWGWMTDKEADDFENIVLGGLIIEHEPSEDETRRKLKEEMRRELEEEIRNELKGEQVEAKANPKSKQKEIEEKVKAEKGKRK